MKIYLVGGAVRDKLLGLSIKERDWVVVEATPEDMLAQGYRQVGKEFPVFLHPKTNEEYALARMERKVKPGYKGFTFDTSPTVSLEDDLERRDLTINAMAESSEGKLIDPYHGKQDLEQKILRHVSPAFAEDPVRILRVGRFLARYNYLGFKVAPETINLMKQMVHAGEVDALVAERVWKELERALSEKNPEKFFVVLAECNALPRLFPGLEMSGRGIKALQEAAKHESTPIVRFAVLFHDTPNANHFIAKLCDRYRAPNEYRDLARLTAAHYKTALKLAQEAGAPTQETAEKLLSLFYALDIFRREARFKQFVIALESIAKTKDIPFNPKQMLALAHAAKSYPVQELLNRGLNGPILADALKEKRKENIAQLLSSQ